MEQHASGTKLDAGKAPVITFALQYFPDALAAVAWVSEVGARKYTPWGWKSISDGIKRYTDALGRHLGLERHQNRDPEIDVPHAAQVAWNALARLQLMIDAGQVEVRKSRAEFSSQEKMFRFTDGGWTSELAVWKGLTERNKPGTL